MGMEEPIWQQSPPCVLQTCTRPYFPLPETHSIGSEGLHQYRSVFIFLKVSLLNINDCMTSMLNASVFSQQASGAIHSTEEREKGELLFFLNITAFYKVLGGLLGAALLCWRLYINQPVVNDQTWVCEAGIDLMQDPGAAGELLVILWNSLKENPNQKAINLACTLFGIYI